MPHKVWAVGEEVLAADFNTYVQDQTVQVFPSLSTLQSDWPSAPIGAQAFVSDTGVHYVHAATGASGWMTRGSTSYVVGLSGTVPNSTTAVTAGTIAVTAAPFTRILWVGASTALSGGSTVAFQLTVDAGSAQRFARGTCGTNAPSIVITPLVVVLTAGTAVTVTATVAAMAAPGSTTTILAESRISRMDAILLPA